MIHYNVIHLSRTGHTSQFAARKRSYYYNEMKRSGGSRPLSFTLCFVEYKASRFSLIKGL